jgi:translation initiation factor IF-3
MIYSFGMLIRLTSRSARFSPGRHELAGYRSLPTCLCTCELDLMDVGVLRSHPFYLFKRIKPKISRRWEVISRDHQINEEIRAREVRVVGAEGEQLGIMSLRDALQASVEANMDLVNVAPQAKPPVCRIMDYGKFRYEQQKKEKEARKNQKIVEIKEIRLGVNIDEHDYQTKLRNAIKFLNDGDKVKCTVRFRGREITHAEIGQRVLDRLANEVQELCVVERRPKLEGKSMIMILAPKPQ